MLEREQRWYSKGEIERMKTEQKRSWCTRLALNIALAEKQERSRKKTYSSDNMKGNEDRNSSGRSKNEVTLDR